MGIHVSKRSLVPAVIMAKSLRSKWKRKMGVIKRVRYGEKENARLLNMVENGKIKKAAEDEGVVVRTADDIKKIKSNFFPLLEDKMETQVAVSDHHPVTLKNKDGNYPKWMSKTKIDKIKKVAKKKKNMKKLGQKKAKV